MDLKEQIARRRLTAGIPQKETSEEAKPDGATVRVTTSPISDPDAFLLDIDDIAIETQARKNFRNIESLAESIREHGQLHPVVVEPLPDGRFRLIAGERRLRAIRDILGRKEIRATLKKAATDQISRRILQLVENNQRDNYDPFELAEEITSLQEITGWKDIEVARQLGVTRGWVSKQLSLLAAPAEIQEAIRRGEMAATTWFNEKKTIMEKGRRETFVKIPYDSTLELIELLQRLAARYATNPIDLSRKPTKKEIVAILTTRPAELKGCLE